MTTDDQTLVLQEAAALAKVDEETFRQLAADGEVFGAKIGKQWVFLRSDVMEYIRKQTREQTARRREGAAVVRPVVRRRRVIKKLPLLREG